MTRAPSSARSSVQYGPARMRDRSTIVMPESGPCGIRRSFWCDGAGHSPARAKRATRLPGSRERLPPGSGDVRGAEAELVGKADELGEPGGLHLPHDLAAMHLDGHLADPELAGDLLVEPAGDDEAQDLSLAGGQGLEAGPQFGEAYLVGAADAVLFKRDTDRIEQILVAERLGQKLDGARLHRRHRHRDVAIAGDEDDRQRRVRGGNIPLHSPTAATRKTYLQHNAARTVRTSTMQECMPQ